MIAGMRVHSAGRREHVGGIRTRPEPASGIDLGESPHFVIADDEPWARRRLRELILDHLPDARFSEAAEGVQALGMIRRHKPVAVFLDVRMPLTDGLEVARLLRAEGNETPLVFTTAYGDFALRAFDVYAFAYLLKPIDGERLGDVLRRLSAHVGAPADQGPRLIVRRSGGERLSLSLGRICYFEARDRYVVAVTRESRYVLDCSLRELEKRYGSEVLRIHRRVLVLRSRLERLVHEPPRPARLYLQGIGMPLDVSRRHLGRVRAAFTDETGGGGGSP